MDFGDDSGDGQYDEGEDEGEDVEPRRSARLRALNDNDDYDDDDDDDADDDNYYNRGSRVEVPVYDSDNNNVIGYYLYPESDSDNSYEDEDGDNEDGEDSDNGDFARDEYQAEIGNLPHLHR